MTSSAPVVLQTTAGDVALEEYRLVIADRAWTILHTGLVLSDEDEQRYLAGPRARLPYGVALWPASIAFAHELMVRGDAMKGRRALELGAGTGLPGIVAAALGAHVVQTDRQPAALHLCRLNAERNGVVSAEQRAGDWRDWHDTARYDCIIGADILYAESVHPHLRSIFESNLAEGGQVLLSDPLRPSSLKLLELLDASGWNVSFNTWSVGAGDAARSLAVYVISRGW